MSLAPKFPVSLQEMKKQAVNMMKKIDISDISDEEKNVKHLYRLVLSIENFFRHSKKVFSFLGEKSDEFSELITKRVLELAIEVASNERFFHEELDDWMIETVFELIDPEFKIEYFDNYHVKLRLFYL